MIAFAAAAVAPGYTLAHGFASRWFRSRALREQLAWSVAVSFGPGLLLLVAAVALGGAWAGALLLLLFAACAIWFWSRHPPVVDASAAQLRVAGAVFCVWAFIVLGSLVDIGTGGRLWMSVTAYDHGLRTSFIDAVLRTGVPPVDPVYWPGHDVPMRYYYFWYAVCASAARLAHISARQALIASCVWPLPGVVGMLALYGRHMIGLRGRPLTRFAVTAASLLSVTGLDLLVTAALHALHTPVLADMEWWAPDQVASWLDTFLWVPHHAAALVAALLGLLLLTLAAETEQGRTRSALAAVAGLSYAAAFGTSAYLGFGVALVTAGWLLRRIVQKNRLRGLQAAGTAAIVAALMLSRFLWQLTAYTGTGRRAAPLYFGLREILLPVVLEHSVFQTIAALHPWRARELAAAILLLPGWGVELGFYAVAFLAALLRWRQSSPGQRTVLWLALCGFTASSFVRSGVISTNDYGIRAALLPQFFLLLAGAWIFIESRRGLRVSLLSLITVGLCGSLYQVILLRTYIPWQQAHGNLPERQLGEDTYALRAAYTAMQPLVTPNARLQFDPADTSFYQYPHLLFAHRPFVTSEIPCNISFGGDPAVCSSISRAVLQMYPSHAEATPDPEQAVGLCRTIGADYLVATARDVAWHAPSGWVWTLPAVVAQADVRIVRCGE